MRVSPCCLRPLIYDTMLATDQLCESDTLKPFFSPKYLEHLTLPRGGEITTRGNMRRVPSGLRVAVAHGGAITFHLSRAARLPSPCASPTPTEERWVYWSGPRGHDYQVSVPL